LRQCYLNGWWKFCNRNVGCRKQIQHIVCKYYWSQKQNWKIKYFHRLFKRTFKKAVVDVVVIERLRNWFRGGSLPVATDKYRCPLPCNRSFQYIKLMTLCEDEQPTILGPHHCCKPENLLGRQEANQSTSHSQWCTMSSLKGYNLKTRVCSMRDKERQAERTVHHGLSGIFKLSSGQKELNKGKKMSLLLVVNE
jgi:hypothetical protein